MEKEYSIKENEKDRKKTSIPPHHLRWGLLEVI